VLDVQLISKLPEALLQHHHKVVFVLSDDGDDSPPDTNALSESGAGGARQPLHQMPSSILS